MTPFHLNVTRGSPSIFSYISSAQPYYICAPDFSSKPVSSNALHKLCSALNMLGYEALIETREVSGMLRTPLLTEATKVAHFKAGKKPIVVSSATVFTHLKALGLPVTFLLKSASSESQSKNENGVDACIYQQSQQCAEGGKSLFIPIIDADVLSLCRPLASHERTGVAFQKRLNAESGEKGRDFGVDAFDLSSELYSSEASVCEILCKVKLFYTYDFSELVDLARLCGCPVVLLSSALALEKDPELLRTSEKNGIAWGDEVHEVDGARNTVLEWRTQYIKSAVDWEQGLRQFIDETQLRAGAMPFEKAWPQSSVDLLAISGLSTQEQGARADRTKLEKVNAQYERWSKHCTPREIDADIYAEHLSTGKVPSISVLIDQRGCSLNALADTLDSLSQCLWQPANLTIVSDENAPSDFENQTDLLWLVADSDNEQKWSSQLNGLTHWVLLIQSGTRLAAQSLVEWGLAINTFAQAELIYSDEDFSGPEGAQQYPFFKPDANIELLRCTNYLGNAVLVRSMGWKVANFPLFDGALYGYALQLLKARGRKALGHIDTMLVHSTGEIPQGLESKEYAACNRELGKWGLAKSIRPLDRLGTWLVDYVTPTRRCVSLVVPTGIQTGYLRSLLESLQRYPQENILEIILVCTPEQVYEVEYALSNVSSEVPLKLVELTQVDYNHSAALNAGVANASGEFILVCDDDTEALHSGWLSCLLGIAMQTDVGCVAPRLMSNRGADARVTGGPLFLGVGGAVAPYNGEVGLLEECGVQSRLQLTQDVSCVAGHCFLFRKADWIELKGFDVDTFGLWFSVLDFCLRMSQLGKRHVWTPLASVLHQGGKTVGRLIFDTRTKLKMADRELTEKNSLLQHWAGQLAKDPCYNRHLSLIHLFDIENTIIVDWQPKRRDRPRVLACPITSGAGQYRVVEPLHALQSAGLAQTCVLIPVHRNHSRILQPLELVRAAPDRLILQHSVEDVQIGLIEKYKIAMPGIEIIQMVDDLLGEVPVKHPNWNFQTREGHQRMVQALKKSDRLVVTTETLKQHYQKYVADVRLMPNCLDTPWADLRRPRSGGGRLRVGWVGAGQHRGDLELITEVVKELAEEVDWVFMGMCTDEIKPYIKEFHGFVPIGDYPKKMASLNLDIAIAPLEKNYFNECKSNLRLLEYGAMGWPVVCSDVFPYQSLNPPVIRCSDNIQEWVAELRKLMLDDALRLQMGEQLFAWVQSNFVLKNKAEEWKSAIFDDIAAS